MPAEGDVKAMALEAVTDEQTEQVEETLDQSAGDDTQTHEGAEGEQADPPADDSSAEDEFFSSEEFDQLAAAGDPAAIRKAMQKAYTQKTQALAAKSKQMEGGLRVLQALQADPQGAVRRMAQELGLAIAEAEQKGEPKSNVLDEARAELTGLFGEGITKQLYPVLEKMLKAHTETALTPVQQMLQAVRQESVQRESEATLQAFKAKHPDYAKYEPIMLKIAENLRPANGVWDIASLEHLYVLATSQANRAKDARANNDRMVDSARAAATSAAPRATPKGGLNHTPPPAKSISEGIDRAFEAAKRGVRYRY